MRFSPVIILTLLAFFVPRFLAAQKVLYSPVIGMEGTTRFEVAGKAGNNYWVQKSKIRYSRRKNGEPWLSDRQLQFDIYDARMNFIRSLPGSLPASLIKEYLVPGTGSFDQLMITSQQDSSYLTVKRFSTAGDSLAGPGMLATLPVKTRTGDYLLLRSPDRRSMLLLVFIPMGGLHPAIRAFHFDSDWNLLGNTLYTDRRLTKPMVQYDIVDYPLESYSSAPVKIDDQGNCWMITSCGINHNYLLTCLRPGNESVACKDVKLAPGLTVEDAALSIDAATETGFAGIVAREARGMEKTVRVIRFQTPELTVQLDTAYYARTNGTGMDPDHLYEEYFMIVPSKGFLFLKEYGRKLQTDHFTRNEEEDEERPGDDFTDENFTKFDNLAGGEAKRSRGQLSLFYFPADSDSKCWSATLNKQQTTELGRSYLSYVFFPARDRLFFLYNSLYRNGDEYGSTTVVDNAGNPLSEDLEYWKIRNTLVFQHARQITPGELAIPYERNARNGFAIIRLEDER